MKVHIPSPLRSYTKNQSIVAADGSSLTQLLDDLDKNYPGIKFRMIDEQNGIRQHIKIYVDKLPVKDLSAALSGSEQVHIICALSGG